MFGLDKSEGATAHIDRFVKQTPGPWTVWQLAPDSDPRERHIVVAGEDYGIEVCGIVGNVIDAELIAAAPEMLEALRATHEWLRRKVGSARPQGAPIEQIEAAIRAAQRR